MALTPARGNEKIALCETDGRKMSVEVGTRKNMLAWQAPIYQNFIELQKYIL